MNLSEIFGFKHDNPTAVVLLLGLVAIYSFIIGFYIIDLSDSPDSVSTARVEVIEKDTGKYELMVNSMGGAEELVVECMGEDKKIVVIEQVGKYTFEQSCENDFVIQSEEDILIY